jgi:hypothetical protein
MVSVADLPGRRLEGLLSVTDSPLTSLKIEDVLTELLNRVREVLEADTAGSTSTCASKADARAETVRFEISCR